MQTSEQTDAKLSTSISPLPHGKSITVTNANTSDSNSRQARAGCCKTGWPNILMYEQLVGKLRTIMFW